MTDTTHRITIEDLDPTWSEWHHDRLPDVHGTPASDGHYWTLNGRRVDGYEAGAVCGLCDYAPHEPRARPLTRRP